MGNHIVGPKSVRGVVDECVVDIVARIHRSAAGKQIVETKHPGVFADGVAGYLRDLVSVLVNRRPACRVSVQDRLERRRLGQYLRAKRGVRREIDESLAEILAQAFVVGEEERLFFLDGAAEAAAKLMQRERRKSGCRIVERRARVERVVTNGVKRTAVILVRAGLRHDVDLSAAGRAALGCVDAGANAKLRDGVESDVEPGVGFLSLLLYPAGVDAVKSEIAIVQGVAGEADGALGPVTVIDGAWRQQHQAGPISSANRNLFNLLSFNQATHRG